MEIPTLCAVVVSLSVVPNRSQFFQYESVTLSCRGQGNPLDWRVKRNTTTRTNQVYPPNTDRRNDSTCFFENLYEADSGVYWCESADGRLSSSVSISVTAGSLILESPEHPVDEGEALTLYCRTRTPSFNRTRFYKDQLLIGSSSTGNFTIPSVSKSAEGNYRCEASGAESLGRWLRVREARRPERSPAPLAYVLLPVSGAHLLLMVLMLRRLWRNRKGKVDRTVSYTDVTFTREGRPRTICAPRGSVSDDGAATTFYSRIKP